MSAEGMAMEQELEMVVVWDGTRRRGAYLVTEFDEPRVATVRPDPPGKPVCREIVWQALAAGPKTIRELVAATDYAQGSVHQAIQALKCAGVVTVARYRDRGPDLPRERVYGLTEDAL